MHMYNIYVYIYIHMYLLIHVSIDVFADICTGTAKGKQIDGPQP